MINFSTALIPNNTLGFIAHEENDSFGQTRKNGREPNCSVRIVVGSTNLPDCPPIPADRVQYDYDDRFVQIATAFGSFAQRQIDPLNGRRGFNLKVWSKR